MVMMFKHLHLTCVALSFLSFAIRGVWMMLDSPLLQAKLTKILPHVIDTLLLVSAIGLAVQLGLNPTAHPWLLAKIGVLVLYIGIGTVALKPGRPKQVRVIAWSLALLCFFFIVSAALTKSAAGFFAFAG